MPTIVSRVMTDIDKWIVLIPCSSLSKPIAFIIPGRTSEMPSNMTATPQTSAGNNERKKRSNLEKTRPTKPLISDMAAMAPNPPDCPISTEAGKKIGVGTSTAKTPLPHGRGK